MPNARVLHVYQDFFPKRCGIEDHVLTLAQSPSDHYAHTVLIAASGPRTRHDTVAGVPVVRAATIGRYYSPFCPTMADWIRHINPDLIHLHHPCPMAFLATMVSSTKVPVVVGYHNDIVKPRALIRLYSIFQRTVLRRANAIVVGTQSYLDASPFLAEFRAKCHVVPYGIPLSSLTLRPKIQTHVAQIRHRHPGPIVLFVGRLCYYKGLAVAIEAMRDVAATLLIVGTGPLGVQIQRQIVECQLSQKVILVGPVDDDTLAAYYHACDMLILPSTYTSEAFGLVMLQAQACTRPVICSDLPGLVIWLVFSLFFWLVPLSEYCCTL